MNTIKSSGRIALIDNIRGIIVIAFLALHAFWGNTQYDLPEWITHNGHVADIPIMSFANIAIMDFGPVAFYFIIGLTIFMSFNKRVERDGKKAAYSRYLLRNAVLFSITKIILFVRSKVTGGDFLEWDNICSIAFVGFLLMLFMFDCIRKKPYVRLVLGIAVLAIYKLAYKQIMFLYSTNGGIGACIGFVGVVLITSYIAELARESILKHAILTFLLFIVAWLVSTTIEKPDFSDYNMAYMVMCLFGLNLVYFIFSIIDKFFLKGKEIPIIAPLGKSLIFFLYLTFITDAIKYFMDPLSLTQSSISFFVCLFAYLIIGYFFGKKKIIVKL
ncbi:MAG: hypothetical protein LBF68_08145 [Christensenellaceae bacterium]|jgi:hypothetical protein|nr:hypothetical protein [Christensenellaceae bacterium]